MSAARDLLADLAEIGAMIEPAGNRIIIRAGATAIPADLVSRIRQAKAELLAALEDHPIPESAELLAPMFTPMAPAAGEPSLDEPCAARRGRVDEQGGVLFHFCAVCGAWGAFGYGVGLRNGRMGRWYCGEHRPQQLLG